VEHYSSNRIEQPKVGISACLTGEHVRYDGGHKLHHLINEQLSPWLNLIVFCPEAQAGLGTPRPPVKLVQTGEQADSKHQLISALGVEDPALDVTHALTNTSQAFAQATGAELTAYIVKSRSPSCGEGSTPLFDENDGQIATTDGLFVAQLKAYQPQLLIADEEWFSSIERCEIFIKNCYERYTKNTEQRT
jgi:uncharacterized protein YbbK (DUF523 family)